MSDKRRIVIDTYNAIIKDLAAKLAENRNCDLYAIFSTRVAKDTLRNALNKHAIERALLADVKKIVPPKMRVTKDHPPTGVSDKDLSDAKDDLRSVRLVFKTFTSDGVPWGTIAWYELDVRDKEGSMCRRLKEASLRNGQPTRDTMTVSELLSDDQFAKVLDSQL
jgi:hypothetical protein